MLLVGIERCEYICLSCLIGINFTVKFIKAEETEMSREIQLHMFCVIDKSFLLSMSAKCKYCTVQNSFYCQYMVVSLLKNATLNGDGVEGSFITPTRVFES